MASIRDEIQTKVNNCNDSLHNISSKVGELDVFDELQDYVNQLSEVWQTTGGEETIKKLNAIIKKLKEDTINLKSAMKEIESDNYIFNTKELRPYTKNKEGEWIVN